MSPTRLAPVVLCAVVLSSALVGHAMAQTCAAEPDSLNFNTAIAGTTVTRTTVITNTTGDPMAGVLTLTGYHQGYYSFDGGYDTRGYNLAPGESDTVNVHLSAIYNGPFDARLELNGLGAPCGDDFVPLHGYGNHPPESGDPACTPSPSIQLLFPHTVVGDEAVDDLWIINSGGDYPQQHAGILEGSVPTVAGDFFIPWGGDFTIATHHVFDVYWRPTTPGVHSVTLPLPPLCEIYHQLELIGLALVDGAAADITATELTFGPMGVGDTQYRQVTVRNMGTDDLHLVIPDACGPFTIVGGFRNRTLVSGAEEQVTVEFTPATPGLQSCTLDLGDPAVPTVELTGVVVEDGGTQDQIGIWFEQTGTQDRHDTTLPFEPVTAYLMILNPSTEWGASGWECCVEMVGDGVAATWDLAGSALNVETPPCFSVGMQSGPLTGADAIVLATLDFIQPDPDSPTYFFVHPAGNPSVPGVPVYADGIDPGVLIPLTPASGDEAVFVAAVNAPATTPVEEETPRRFALTGAAPNPFNPATVVSFETARDGRTVLDVHDLRGRRVRRLADAVMSAGPHAVVWDGRADDGAMQPSGAYFVRLRSGGETGTMKVMLAK